MQKRTARGCGHHMWNQRKWRGWGSVRARATTPARIPRRLLRGRLRSLWDMKCGVLLDADADVEGFEVDVWMNWGVPDVDVEGWVWEMKESARCGDGDVGEGRQVHLLEVDGRSFYSCVFNCEAAFLGRVGGGQGKSKGGIMRIRNMKTLRLRNGRYGFKFCREMDRERARERSFNLDVAMEWYFAVYNLIEI